MTHITVMKQALDALESASPLGATSSSDDVADAAHKKHCDALKALRAAIAQPESEPAAWMTHHDEPMLFPTWQEAFGHCDT